MPNSVSVHDEMLVLTEGNMTSEERETVKLVRRSVFSIMGSLTLVQADLQPPAKEVVASLVEELDAAVQLLDDLAAKGLRGE